MQEEPINIIIDQWIKSIKLKLNHAEKELGNSFKRHTRKFNDKYIREMIYDYLDNSIYKDIDGEYKLLASSSNGEKVILHVLYSNGDCILCENNYLRQDIKYVTHIYVQFAGQKGHRILDVELATAIGYKE